MRMLCDCVKPRQQLEAEILVLRHQLNVLQQRAPRRVHLRWADRALFIWLYRRCPRILKAISILRPETVVRWHRTGFSAYWRWKSRPLGGRPQIGKEVRDLIRRMSLRTRCGAHPRSMASCSSSASRSPSPPRRHHITALSSADFITNIAESNFRYAQAQSLILKRASASRPSGEWSDDDFDVVLSENSIRSGFAL